MPHPTAVRIADAALEVLGTGGIHALSHARVDATAGLPSGSTSNYFRTRARLVDGAVERLRQIDTESFQARLAAGFPGSVDELIAAYVAFTDDALGPSRVRTAARFVIFAQGVVEPTLLEQLNADRRLLSEWTAAALVSLGVRQATEVAPLLLAGIEGLLQHHLSGFTPGPAEPDVRRLITALTNSRA
ncbi:TetR/AcrR family transcriptional regulator [Actinoplanes sp. L3-i22]|uniref:TetR/AcrR family transcriptional regulator n=1 Tax=Actinoplanes sp. L3-i22 TaxID=2836373 RepID=UPI001C78C0DE|nr:TetR/AcrR family transcriptional regulator [Actinoplanes sp. L3-i22]BCY11979.1 putative transcriptional regulator, TetR [Actinoplanes sp. L3-i22]